MKQQANQDDVIGMSSDHVSARGSAPFDILGFLHSDQMFSKSSQKPPASSILGPVLGYIICCSGEDDDDLYESLARARKAADKQQKGASLQDPFAEQLASRREDDEAQLAMDTDKPKGLQLRSFYSGCRSQAEVAASVLCRQLAFCC
jgi:hypothetical protein